jgi:poly-gamma-glutamate capsule biosynthesis protein CapA/YwtB (metallophosphatase superfamily)
MTGPSSATTIGLVGDVMLRTTEAGNRPNLSPGFAAAIERLRSLDFVIANLEMPLSRRGYRVPKHSNLRSDPDLIDLVPAMGIGVVSLANNHMMDFGPDALLDTVTACERAGLSFAGAGNDIEAALAPAVFTVGGVRLGLLSLACTLPMESDAGIDKPGIAPLRVGFSFEVDANLMVEQPGTMPVVQSWAIPDDQAIACERIAALKRQVDLVVVAIHWGVPSYWLSPYQGLLATYQQPLGRALIDAGADLICGHHSHSLHPIEVYNGKPIFYSLGNFLFEGPKGFMEPESVIVELTLSDPLGYRLIPLILDDDGFPHLVEGDAATAVLEKLAALSRPFGDAIHLESGYATVG